MLRQRNRSTLTGTHPRQRPSSRTLDPLTAVGALLALVAATALLTYTLLTVPGKLAAKAGPPQEYLAAATRQAELTQAAPTATPSQETDPLTAAARSSVPAAQMTADADRPSPMPAVTQPAVRVRPTANPFGDWPLPSWVEERYWLSIPSINLEAPVIALSLADKEVEGVKVLRLPVPNSYAVSWDITSAEPGFAGNTILTGHSNLYGGVFSNLDELTYGAEVAVWSEYGVFSYYVNSVEYIEENGQPLEVRYNNAQWLNDSVDDRVTLITCWPNSTSSHRLVVVAAR
jgi:LPXTG-site transpeptidase (sortase) family protein